MSNPTKTKRAAATERAKSKTLAALLRDGEQLATAVSRYASLEITEAAINLEMEAEAKVIMERGAAKMEPITKEKEELFEMIETYVRKHRSELFRGEEKSTKVNGHELALRKGNLTVGTTKPQTQKNLLLELIEDADEAFADTFVRWTEALNKEAILSAWDAKTNTWKPGFERLGEMGVTIDQVERFHLNTARALSKASNTTGAATPVSAE